MTTPSPRDLRLRILAKRFRAAILACDRVNLPITLRDFPKGACGDASLLLAKYLEQFGFSPLTYVWGWRTTSFERGRQSHAWLEQDGLIIDITADQFSNAEPVLVTTDRSWHEQFEVEQKSPADYEQYEEESRRELHAAFQLVNQHCDVEPSYGPSNLNENNESGTAD